MGLVKCTKEKSEAVIRFRRYTVIEKEPSNYYRAQLMLYYPWHDEDRDLLSNCATYEEHYRSNVKQVVDNNEAV